MKELPTNMDRRRGILGRLGADERGASVTELALMLPVLGLLVMGIIDVAAGFARMFALEQAAQRSVERVTQTRTATDYQFIREEAASAAEVPIGNVTVVQRQECGDTSPQVLDWSGTCPDGQMVARFVTVRIFSDYRPRFSYGPLGRGFALTRADGTVRLTADAGVRVHERAGADAARAAEGRARA